MTKSAAMEHALSLSKKFVEHFDKIYNDNDNDAISHWASEMQSWLNDIISIKLKNTNKPLSLQQKMDWFFTGGSDSETLFPDNKTEAEVYDDFISKVAFNNDIKQSLKELELVFGLDESAEESDFSKRWDEKFGKPTTRVMTVEEFDKWFKEMREFE